MSAADAAWGYGVLENEGAFAWENRFASLIDPEHLGGDDGSQAEPCHMVGGPDIMPEAQLQRLWFIDQIATHEEMRRNFAPRIATGAEALATAAGNDDVAWQVLGVLFLAAGVVLPSTMKARVLHAFDREIAHDRAEEESSGWSHWSIRTDILRAVRAWSSGAVPIPSTPAEKRCGRCPAVSIWTASCSPP